MHFFITNNLKQHWWLSLIRDFIFWWIHACRTITTVAVFFFSSFEFSEWNIFDNSLYTAALFFIATVIFIMRCSGVDARSIFIFCLCQKYILYTGIWRWIWVYRLWYHKLFKKVLMRVSYFISSWLMQLLCQKKKLKINFFVVILLLVNLLHIYL